MIGTMIFILPARLHEGKEGIVDMHAQLAVDVD
jgi:hypothetical protein